jgi:micrococcal nuclease
MRFRPKVNEKWLGIGLTLLGFAGLLRGLWMTQAPVGAPPSAQNAPAVSAAGRGPDLSSATEGRLPCRVLVVFDGDTLGCDLNQDGELQKPQEQVRLLGIDSPEMHYSRKNATYGSNRPQDEPFAQEASRWLTRQASGKTVYLEFDARRHDKYQRTLAYVFLGTQAGVSLNEQLLSLGYATTLFLGMNRRYEAVFLTTEAQARQQQRGLWGRSRSL